LALKAHKHDARYYADGVRRGDIALLSRAITLVESTGSEDQELARNIMTLIPKPAGATFRLGITGVPGVGKSTFIESFGQKVTAEGHRLAVLAVDPSSKRSGGSILGDKTRMEKLSSNENVFIRPSPSAGNLGGITRASYETIVLCEAAGFDYVIVETVGVGQSEIAVSGITDFFLLLMLAGAGDELQGIKRGIMEMADALVITKADSGNEKKAASARAEYARAMHLLQPPESGWVPQVMTCSSISGTGIADVYGCIEKYRAFVTASGYFQEHRRKQQLNILVNALDQHILSSVYTKAHLRRRIEELSTRPGIIDPFAELARLLKETGL
jgi:LAO/AO transport system kinase